MNCLSLFEFVRFFADRDFDPAFQNVHKFLTLVLVSNHFVLLLRFKSDQIGPQVFVFRVRSQRSVCVGFGAFEITLPALSFFFG